MKNRFQQTLAAEAAAKEALEAANVNKTEVETIIDRENGHAEDPRFGIFETIKLFQEGKRINVKLKVLAREPQEGEDISAIEVIEMPIGCATTEEDAVAMVEDLRPYAPNGKLLTEKDVVTAMGARMHADQTAGDAFEAGVNPDRKIVVDGQEFLICGTQIRNPENGELILELKSLPRLTEEDFPELVEPAIRQALARQSSLTSSRGSGQKPLFIIIFP